MTHQLAFIHSPEIERFSYPPEAPFKTQRAGLTYRKATELGLLSEPHVQEVAPQPAGLRDLEQYHAPGYLEQLRRATGGDLTVDGLHMGLGTPDTPVFKDLYEYACWAAGSTLAAADGLLSGDVDIAFNPSGGFHHAMKEKAAGFCYVNDVVLGCMRLADAGKRVLFLDVDAHHGDGVQEAFFERNDVMTISTHESGKTLFPWGGFEDEVGKGAGEGYNVNVPLPVEIYDDAYLALYHRIIPPLIRAFDPDVLVVELGMDALAGDPLTHLSLTNNAYAEVAKDIMSYGKPILATGGGGYHPQNTVRGWTLLWRILCGEPEEDPMMLGLGGVMLESTDWAGGLKDRVLPVQEEQRKTVEPAIRGTMERIVSTVFPYHGLSPGDYLK